MKLIADWGPDALLLAGASLLSYAAWMVYAPAGFAVAGVALLLAGYVLMRAK